ncbi:hypothetical protein MKQ70_01620 [Chitinophaga sedimenti]|uniref:RNA polymerase sigma factor n=1 Tax=Chitinophaga sedimenti TaxID=2033606 RepID=UPI002006460E|nr:hypothetical protein [Chitinophaga sedimenti]MCK7553769.1 hypothetical protein [Chitinophaga sedimenti]
MSNSPRHTPEEPSIDLRQIVAGDEQAFRRLFQHYSPRLNQFAFSIIKTREATAEIVDDVFIRLWKQRANAGAIANIRVYLYVAVKTAPSTTCLPRRKGRLPNHSVTSILN